MTVKGSLKLGTYICTITRDQFPGFQNNLRAHVCLLSHSGEVAESSAVGHQVPEFGARPTLLSQRLNGCEHRRCFGHMENADLPMICTTPKATRVTCNFFEYAWIAKEKLREQRKHLVSSFKSENSNFSDEQEVFSSF